MNETTWLRITGIVCLTISYVLAVAQGFNGILFTAYTNAALSILLLSPKIFKKKTIIGPQLQPSPGL